MNLSTFTGALFDLDGTLIDSTKSIARSWSAVLNEIGIPLDVMPTLHGSPSRQSLKRLLPHASSTEIDYWAKKIEDLEVADTEGISLLPGAEELLNFLESRSIDWFVVTSCTRELGNARAKSVGLSLPSRTVFFDDVIKGKPDPDPYLLGLERMGEPASNVVVFEDAPAGIKSAKAAKINVVAVVTTHTADELTEADYVAHSLLEILAKFKE